MTLLSLVYQWFTNFCAILPNRFLPLAVWFVGVSFHGLISLAIADEDYADGHQRRGSDQDEDAALQCLNHASAGGRGLGIAERAALGGGRDRREQED